MGRMVRGDDLDRAVGNALQKRPAVGAAPQRRVHLEAALLPEVLVAQQQVVRRRLAAHFQPFGPGLPHQIDALLRGDVTDMVLAAGLLRERDVAFHLPPFALGTDTLVSVLAAVDPVVDVAPAQQVVDFAVGHYGLAHGGGPAHRLLHQGVRLHAAAVVGESDYLRGEGREIDQFAAPALAHRDRAVGFHAHHGVAADNLQLSAERRRRIGRRVQVGHRADRGIPPAGRGGRTRRDGLLLREARLAQVHMHVDQPRHEVPPPEVHHPVARPRLPGGRDAAPFDGDQPRLETAVAENFRVGVKCLHSSLDTKK